MFTCTFDFFANCITSYIYYICILCYWSSYRTYDSLKSKKGDEAIHPAGKSAGFLALNYNNNNKPLPMLGAAVFSFLLQYCANGIS